MTERKLEKIERLMASSARHRYLALMGQGNASKNRSNKLALII